jgi:transcriptional regulator with XRE-family HTH domain
MDPGISEALRVIRRRSNASTTTLAAALGASRASLERWEAGTASPSPNQVEVIKRLLAGEGLLPSSESAFPSRGVRRSFRDVTLFDQAAVGATLARGPLPGILSRITLGSEFVCSPYASLSELLAKHSLPAETTASTPSGGMSAGKNTYTYDAHTYHTKVPPQGIAELLGHYLPSGGLVLDPFAGSGMTGVAARTLGLDCLLTELSPAACFIASRFVSSISPALFADTIRQILEELDQVRRQLYTTICRECGRRTELLYMVWAYRVTCPHCANEFNLWDACRKYGRTVREHKILSQFPCPACRASLTKSKLQRSGAEPVQVGYRCCGSRQQEKFHEPLPQDLQLIAQLEREAPVVSGFFPTTAVRALLR